ncbi:MAG TPA: MFS transporter [Candidatus Bathyarchaeia archaeon]|nr:MFS transporter [Candidatus Bathyarchaeia archaeon]
MPLIWLSRNGKLLLLEKAVRTVPYGFLGVLFGVYLAQLEFSILQIGIVVTLTTATSTLYTFIASLVADRIGRKKTLIFFALTDALAGVLLLISTSWWAPVAAGIVGNMSVGSGEVGPYLTLEQAILPSASDPNRRTYAFSLYNLTGYAASSGGALLAGVPDYLGIGLAGYRPLFLAYLVSGFLGAAIYSTLSKSVELSGNVLPTRRVLSDASKPIVKKLSALFAVDAFAGGFVGTVILSVYFYQRYSLSLASLGLLFFGTQVITALSFLVAARIAHKIGLLKTMVFTHIPSNILLAVIAFAPSAATAVLLLLGRQSLSQMDVPTRQSFIMSIVPEHDRTPAAGFTNVSRAVANSASPSLAGYGIARLWIGSPFVIAGLLKIVYDLALYRSFRKTVVPQDEED